MQWKDADSCVTQQLTNTNPTLKHQQNSRIINQLTDIYREEQSKNQRKYWGWGLLTHPQVVHPLADPAVLLRDIQLKVLIEAGLDGGEPGQRGPVVFFDCQAKRHNNNNNNKSDVMDQHPGFCLNSFARHIQQLTTSAGCCACAPVL